MTTASTARKPSSAPEDASEPSETVTVQRARDTLTELTLRAQFGSEVFVLERRGQPTAVIIGFKEYERLKALDTK